MTNRKNWPLLAAFIIMISCRTSVTSMHVEEVLLLNDFPSGSSLEYYNNRLYLSGDDATQLLILDTNYNRADSIILFKSGNARIPKALKTDLEASAIITYNNQPYLLLVGSASLDTREKIVLVSLHDTANVQVQATSVYFKRLHNAGLTHINIEGATMAGTLLVLANRGNLEHPVNQLVFTDANFWLHQQTSATDTAIITWPKIKSFAGISGLNYIEKDDLLLFTASTEVTGNSFDDGKIGDSYIGWIKNISQQSHKKEITADGFINLSIANSIFDKEKIESICVSYSQGNIHTIHLVSDNDNGISKLFRLRLMIE